MHHNVARIGQELRAVEVPEHYQGDQDAIVGTVGVVTGMTAKHVQLNFPDGLFLDFRWEEVQEAELPWRREVRAVVTDPVLVDAFQRAAGIKDDLPVPGLPIEVRRRSLAEVIDKLLDPYSVPEETKAMVLSCFHVWVQNQGDVAVQNDPKYGPITKALADELAAKIYAEQE